MKVKKRYKWLVAVLVLLAAGTGIWWWCHQPEHKVSQVSSGRLDRYPGFKSRYVSSRDVAVWLPAGYRRGDSVDVLYMHDGQMLFDSLATWNGQEWQADETAGRLIAQGKTHRFIIVAVDNTDDRLYEYFPDKCRRYLPPKLAAEVDSAQYHGDEYLKFLVTEVKPFVEKQYRPLTGPEHTFIAGSSMGGLISLYAICEYPQVFGGAICMSTHSTLWLWSTGSKSDFWAEAFTHYVDNNLPPADGHKIYMDHGTKGFDAEYGPHQKRLDQLFAKHGWNSDHYRFEFFPGHDHKETFWAERLDTPLIYMLGKDGQRD